MSAYPAWPRRQTLTAGLVCVLVVLLLAGWGGWRRVQLARAGEFALPLPPSVTVAPTMRRLGWLQCWSWTFTTREQPAEVAAFYDARLAAMGWSAGAESGAGAREYARGQQVLQVSLTAQADGTAVGVLLVDRAVAQERARTIRTGPEAGRP